MNNQSNEDIENQIICKDPKYNLWLFLCLIILYLIYFTLSIMSLNNLPIKQEKNICKSSHIWEYLLTSLIFIGIKIRILLEEKINKYIKITIITVPLLLLCWGIYEIYGVSCVSNLQNTDIYKIVNIQILLYIILYGILTIWKWRNWVKW